MKKSFFVLFILIGSINVYAEKTFTFRGEVFDYHSNEMLFGTLIMFYSEGVLIGRVFADRNGKFEFTTTEPIDMIELRYLGSFNLRIIDIDTSDERINDFIFRIPLLEVPLAFMLVSWNPGHPTPEQIKKMDEDARIIENGIRLICENGNEITVRYRPVTGDGRGGYQFIKFSELINCEQ